jgi:hypothetical protein
MHTQPPIQTVGIQEATSLGIKHPGREVHHLRTPPLTCMWTDSEVIPVHTTKACDSKKVKVPLTDSKAQTGVKV